MTVSLELARTEVDSAGFSSMTPACPEVHLFEREIAEQWGVVPEGHPWFKPVRFEPSRGVNRTPSDRRSA